MSRYRAYIPVELSFTIYGNDKEELQEIVNNNLQIIKEKILNIQEIELCNIKKLLLNDSIENLEKEKI